MTRTFCAALLLVAVASSAQVTLPENFATERLRLSGARSGIIDVSWASMPDHFAWDVGVWGSYSKNPLVLYRLSDGQRVGSLLADRVGLSVAGAFSFNKRIGIDFEIPMVAVNSRADTIDMVTTQPLPSISGFALGDVKLAPKIGLLMWQQQAIDLAVQATITLPSGGAAKYAGDTGVTVMPELLLSRPFGNVRTALNLGVNIRPTSVAFLDQHIDSEMLARLGLAYRFNQKDTAAIPLEIGVSAMAGTSLGTPFKNANQNPAEVKFSVSYEVAKLVQLYAGGGVGVSRGWGIPDYRVLAGVRVGDWEDSSRAAVDDDEDGVLDAVDRCPKEPEDHDGYQDDDGCPELDNDLDGVPDAEDGCPNIPGLKENKGCPQEKKDSTKTPVKVLPKTAADDRDTDKDHILDSADRCPNEAEDFDGFEDSDGCPEEDNDGDGILDPFDSCPNEKGVPELNGCADHDDDNDGVPNRLDNCPKEAGEKKNAGCIEHQLAVIGTGKITAYDAVRFVKNQTVIEANSFELLDNVALILKNHPEIIKLRIESHTDNVGGEAKNLRLSQDRASAVKTYLVKKGISTKRLEGTGFGQTKPIADNKTPIGRIRNNRMEFNVLIPAPNVKPGVKK